MPKQNLVWMNGKLSQFSNPQTVKGLYLLLKELGIKWNTIVYGPMNWGDTKIFGYHVFTRKPSAKRLAKVKDSFPSKSHGGHTQVVENKVA